MRVRALVVSLVCFIGQHGRAQVIDSIRVFKGVRMEALATPSAEAAAWRLLRARAEHVVVKGEDLDGLNNVLAERAPLPHAPTQLTDVTQLGFAYIGKAPHAFCIADGAGLVVDLTTRRYFPITDMLDRTKLRLLLAAAGL